jgi:hypothetical protein
VHLASKGDRAQENNDDVPRDRFNGVHRPWQELNCAQSQISSISFRIEKGEAWNVKNETESFAFRQRRRSTKR